MGFSRQEYWSGLPFPHPGDLPNPGTESESLMSPALQVDSLSLNHPGSPFLFRPSLDSKPISKGMKNEPTLALKITIPPPQESRPVLQTAAKSQYFVDLFHSFMTIN